MKTIAVLDDEPDILELVCLHLERAGFKAIPYECASPFLRSLHESRPDLLILDLMLPDMHGTAVCRKIRSDPSTRSLPSILLTAMVDEPERITGLEMGADDYITKPFSPRELVARVRAVLRRTADRPTGENEISIGPIVLFPDRFRAEVSGVKVDLTPTEFRILLTLAESPGRVFSRAQILETLWEGEKFVFERTVDVHIRNIREKLGSESAMLQNVRGIGYRLEKSK